MDVSGSVLGVLLCVSVLDMVSGICPEGTYGYECGYQCHCPLDKCNATSGCSPGDCDTAWSGRTCRKGNMALNKPTSASSVYYYGDPGNAVNGDNSASDHRKCFHSGANDGITEAWWRVDLGEMVRIRHVTIYFRTDYKVHRNGIRIYTADTVAYPTDGVNCYNVTGNRNGTDIPDVLKVTCSGEGRYLALYTTTVNNDFLHVPMMDFCEVEVDVCSNGTFGADCDNYCHCDGEVCDYVSGICPSGVCLPGWTTAACDTVCEFGRYGPNCRLTCPMRNCKGDNSSCDRVTGQCVGGCEAGWNGTDCTLKCLHSYGDGCSNMCSDRKCAESSSGSCDHVTGRCEGGCRSGWKGTDCTEACIQGVEYGANCVGNCRARMCEEGAGDCPRDTGRCEAGCQSGWKGEDCTQKCLHSYGDGCSNMCSDRKCAESSSGSCDHVTGRCEGGCRSGWKGTDCTEACIQGVEYGANCVGNCRARMCEEGAGDCPRDTGRCEAGCQSGWKGEDCTQRSLGDNSITPLSAGLLGALSMLVAMAVVMGGVCLWRRKTHVKNHEKKSSTGENAAGLPKTASDYDVISGSQYATLDGRSPDMYESLNVSGVCSNSQVHI